jgi:molybdopterin-guanine dinucleotide biosynthesis protein A
MHSRSSVSAPLVGILAGGRGTRMGGADKAWLRLPGGEALIERWLRVCAAVQLEAVMVGGHPPPGVVLIQDEPAGLGPIGGLRALLEHARDRSVIAVACDMPYVTEALLHKLATQPSLAPALAPRALDSGKWQPLFARYTQAVLPPLQTALHAGVGSLQRVLNAVATEELSLSSEEHAALRDWDEPADMT